MDGQFHTVMAYPSACPTNACPEIPNFSNPGVSYQGLPTGIADAAGRVAAADVRSAVPDAEAYFSDVGNYTAMTATTGDAPDTGGLKGIDGGLSPAVTVASSTATTYCLQATVNTHTSHVSGPGGTVAVDNGACP